MNWRSEFCNASGTWAWEVAGRHPRLIGGREDETRASSCDLGWMRRGKTYTCNERGTENRVHYRQLRRCQLNRRRNHMMGEQVIVVRPTVQWE